VAGFYSKMPMVLAVKKIITKLYHLRLYKLKTGPSSFGGKKNRRKMRGHFFQTIFYDQTIVGIISLVSLQVLNSVKPIFFCYYINRKDMTCHESKISFVEYVR